MKVTKGELDIWHCERVVNADEYNIIFGYDRKADERRVHQYGLMKGTESNLERIVDGKMADKRTLCLFLSQYVFDGIQSSSEESDSDSEDTELLTITPNAFVADLLSAVHSAVSLNWTSDSLSINSALLEVHLHNSIFAALKIVLASRIRFSASSTLVSPPSQSSKYNCCCSCRTVSGCLRMTALRMNGLHDNPNVWLCFPRVIDPNEPDQLPVLRADLHLEKRLSDIGRLSDSVGTATRLLILPGFDLALFPKHH
ncbi:hypothetical protein OUZ56_003365 [Daphnia magna]|uniref:Uncharacterized protein n=1 Tax=Daphnia magna TaxID=35525 RepID=A0ABR0A8R2_9CRUS|nr:hypothetical protein OUZ56_003365 [Daphnia magna]